MEGEPFVAFLKVQPVNPLNFFFPRISPMIWSESLARLSGDEKLWGSVKKPSCCNLPKSVFFGFKLYAGGGGYLQNAINFSVYYLLEKQRVIDCLRKKSKEEDAFSVVRIWSPSIPVRHFRAQITINVPVVFMARYVMNLRGATSLRGALEGVGPENRDFFGPWNGTSKASAIWGQKIRDFQGPPLPMPWVMMLHPSKSLHTVP